MDYAELAKHHYGECCEYESCGWSESVCDVHHINYKLQWDLENKIRDAHKNNDFEQAKMWVDAALSKGFRKFNIKKMQLEKDDRLHNLAVLCPNHHRYVHKEDMGMTILSKIPKRKN
jgi:hypothetical protein